MRSIHPASGGRPLIDLSSLVPSSAAGGFLGGSGGKVTRFDADGAVTQTLSHGDSQEDVFVAWHPDGKRFASADGVDVRLWRVGEDAPYAVVEAQATLLSVSNGVLLGVVDHTGLTLISFDDGKVLASRGLSDVPGARPRGAGAFGFLLVDASGVWLANETKATKLVTPLANVFWVAGTAETRRVAAANATSVVVEDLDTGAVRTFALENASALALSPDGKRLVLALRDERVVYDVDSGAQLSRWRVGTGDFGRTTHALLADTFIGSSSGGFARNNARTGAELGLERHFAERLSSLSFSPDGAQLAVLAAEAVLLFDGKTGTWQRNVPLPSRTSTWSESSLAFVSNNELCVSADGQRFMVDLAAGAVRPLGGASTGTVQLFHTSKGLMGVVDRSGVVLVDAKTGALGEPLVSERCASACISPDGATLLFEDDDSGKFRVRPIGAGKAAAVNTKLRGLPLFTPDGKPAIASREGDGIEVPGKPKKTFDVPCMSARAFAWSPDGARIALLDTGDEVFLGELE